MHLQKVLDARIQDSLLLNNLASQGHGGALSVYNSQLRIMGGSRMESNQASLQGLEA